MSESTAATDFLLRLLQSPSAPAIQTVRVPGGRKVEGFAAKTVSYSRENNIISASEQQKTRKEEEIALGGATSHSVSHLGSSENDSSGLIYRK